MCHWWLSIVRVNMDRKLNCIGQSLRCEMPESKLKPQIFKVIHVDFSEMSVNSISPILKGPRVCSTVISYPGSTWRKEHLGVSTVLLQVVDVQMILGFPAATLVMEYEDCVWCVGCAGWPQTFKVTRSDFPIQTWRVIAGPYPTSPDKIRING